MVVAVGNFLTDIIHSNLVLTESEDGSGRIIARGEFGRVDRPTNNKRVYPKKLMGREIKRLQEDMEARRVFGQCDHPSDGRTHLSNVSHMIVGLKLKAGQVLGEAEILDTDAGRNLQQILRAGGQIGISSRGVGSTRADADGNEVVQEDFRLMTYDFVADPAMPTAYPDYFFEEDEMGGQKMTIDGLRERFPGLVSEIERIHEEAVSKRIRETFEGVVKTRVAESVEKRATTIREETRIEERDRARADLRDEFALGLLERLDGLRAEVEERVRSEFASDPEVAGARLAVEKIREAIAPFTVPEGAEEAVATRDQQISSLERDVVSRDEDVRSLRKGLDDALGTAREMGFQLYVEKRLRDVEDADLVREMVGDVKQYAEVTELDEKIAACIEAAQTQRDELEAAKAEGLEAAEKTRREAEEAKGQIEEKLDLLKAEIDSIRSEKAKTEEALEKALRLAKEMGLQAYAEQQLAGHPQAAKGRKLLASTGPNTREEIDVLVESLGDPVANGKPHERVRKFLGQGRESLPEAHAWEGDDEDGILPAELAELIPHVNVGELRALSGLED